ncbi:MAG: hypothetical protein HKN92_09640, partial [Chitinophagales bacterium]|nr:hypothetical protein [Chitinophagales bacterium]
MKLFTLPLKETTILLLSITLLTTVDVYSQCTPRSGVFYGELLPGTNCSSTSINNMLEGQYFRMPVLTGASYRISTCGSSFDTQLTGFQGSITSTSIFYNDDNGPACAASLQASVDFVSTFNDYVRVGLNEFNCQFNLTKSAIVTVSQNNNLSFTSSSAELCEGDTRVLTATPASVSVAQPNSGDLGTFSGTGVSSNTFTAPTPAGSNENFILTYGFGYCSVSQTLLVHKNPSIAMAGSDQFVNSNSATLAATTSSIGTGTWTTTGGASISAPGDPGSPVTDLDNGENEFIWTISNGPCSVSRDTTIVFLCSDTVYRDTLYSCNPADTGTVYDTLSTTGCDSIACTTTTLIPDNQSPSVFCIQNIATGLSPTTGTAFVPTSTFYSVATDNCGIDTV